MLKQNYFFTLKLKLYFHQQSLQNSTILEFASDWDLDDDLPLSEVKLRLKKQKMNPQRGIVEE